MWLSGLHIPESYLTALVQATCRMNGWPLDKSTLYTSVTEYATPEDVSDIASQGESLSDSLKVGQFTFMKWSYNSCTVKPFQF